MFGPQTYSTKVLMTDRPACQIFIRQVDTKAEWPDSESSKVLRESRKVPQKYYLFSPSNEKYYKWYYTQKMFNTEKKWVCWTLQVKYTTFWSVNDLRYTIYSPLKLTFSRYSSSRGVKCSVKWSKGVERCTGNTNKQTINLHMAGIMQSTRRPDFLQSP